MRLFLDACVIIYQVEAAEPFYSRLARAVTSVRQAHGRLSWAVSRLSLMECLVRPLREHDTATLARYEEFFAARDLEIVELTPRVVDTATRLRASYGTRTPDAIQAACALSLRGSTVFMTGDASFKKIEGLEVLVV
ncbi:MAG TPA: PIN domain-containing protein [bacterium]